MKPDAARRRLQVMKQVRCSCGYVASAETAEELLAAVEAHIAVAHAPPPVTRPETTRRRLLARIGRFGRG
jgi:predicted small metal-binding protein